MSDIKPVTWNEDPAHFRRTSRREFLYTGLVGGLGLTLGNFFKLRAEEAASAEPLEGRRAIAHPHLPARAAAPTRKSWDPKPLAPIEYRGPLGTVETTIPGERFSEYLKKTAKIADKIYGGPLDDPRRSGARARHAQYVHRLPPVAGDPLPLHGLGRFARARLAQQPAALRLRPERAEWRIRRLRLSLHRATAPSASAAIPAAKGFKVRDLNLHDGITPERFDRRRNILDTVDEHFRTLEKSDALSSMDSFYQSAYALVSSKEAREAFNLAAEPEALRQEYGMNDAGQRMLMARRLVEAGVRFVSVTYGGWDMHAEHRQGHGAPAPELRPGLRRAHQRSRSPRHARQDHRHGLLRVWPLAEDQQGRRPRPLAARLLGRLRRRRLQARLIYGASDPTGSEPDHDPLTVENMAATVFTQLGIQPDKKLMSPGNRPAAIVKDGQVDDRPARLSAFGSIPCNAVPARRGGRLRAGRPRFVAAQRPQ